MQGFTLSESGREYAQLEDGRTIWFSQYRPNDVWIGRNGRGRDYRPHELDDDLKELMGAIRTAYRDRWGYCEGCPDGQCYTRARQESIDRIVAAEIEEESRNPWRRPAGPHVSSTSTSTSTEE